MSLSQQMIGVAGGLFAFQVFYWLARALGSTVNLFVDRWVKSPRV